MVMGYIVIFNPTIIQLVNCLWSNLPHNHSQPPNADMDMMGESLPEADIVLVGVGDRGR